VAIIDAEPSVSTAGNLRIIACFFAILFVPEDNTIVTMDDKASGIAATATATANMNESISCGPILSAPLINARTADKAKIKIDNPKITQPNLRLNTLSFL